MPLAVEQKCGDALVMSLNLDLIILMDQKVLQGINVSMFVIEVIINHFLLIEMEINNELLNLLTLYSVLKNYLFKIGFQGAFGNVWNAILDLPEVYV